jgi:hypothetical protein
MKTSRNMIAAAGAMLIISVCLSCHGGIRSLRDTPEAPGTLPEKVDGWTLDPEIRTFRGDSLFEYIDGAAEMYHKYDFKEVTAGEYSKGESKVVADVYEFAGPDRAFGMYTTLRPDMPDTVMLGVEGFVFGANLVFVKGSYLANVYSYDESADAVSGVRSIASAVAGLLAGTTTKPAMFRIFPEQGRVAFSEKIYAESFLGHVFLTDVYTVDYSIADQEYTLFVMDDPGAAKLEQWTASVVPEYDPDTGYQHLPFDGSRFLLTTDTYHGGILAGIRGERLLGMVGYRKEYVPVISRWLHALVISDKP